MNRKILPPVVFASLCVLGFPPRAYAQHQRECSNASLEGAYAFITTGTVVPARTPRVNVAVLTFDGQGNFFSRFTVNDNGTVTRGIVPDRHYQVNPDCTGSTHGSDGVVDGDLVLIDGGNEFLFIPTRPGAVLTGVGKKQFPRHDEKD